MPPKKKDDYSSGPSTVPVCMRQATIRISEAGFLSWFSRKRSDERVHSSWFGCNKHIESAVTRIPPAVFSYGSIHAFDRRCTRNTTRDEKLSGRRAQTTKYSPTCNPIGVNPPVRNLICVNNHVIAILRVLTPTYLQSHVC